MSDHRKRYSLAFNWYNEEERNEIRDVLNKLDETTGVTRNELITEAAKEWRKKLVETKEDTIESENTMCSSEDTFYTLARGICEYEAIDILVSHIIYNNKVNIFIRPNHVVKVNEYRNLLDALNIHGELLTSEVIKKIRRAIEVNLRTHTNLEDVINTLEIDIVCSKRFRWFRKPKLIFFDVYVG